MRSCLGVLVLMAVAGSAAAAEETSIHPGDIPKREIEVQASNDTLQLKYLANGKMVGVENSRFSGAIFLSEDRDTVLTAGLVFPLDYDLGRFSLMIGPQAYAALLRDENNDIMALALGAEVRYVFDKKTDFAVSGFAYYAPDILTFGSADNLKDFSAQAEIGLSKRLRGFAGFRWFKLDLTEGMGTTKLQDQVFIGIGYRF